jgi:FemAB-related protein (PEP-CTERM system-associated)
MIKVLMNSLTENIIKTPLAQSRLIVKTLAQVGSAAWDDFVYRSECSLPTQTSFWAGLLQKTYGLSCYYLAAQMDGKIQAILPLYRVNSILTGDSLQSMSGAVCASTPEAAQTLLSAADDLAKELKVNYLLLRDSHQAWENCSLEVLAAHRGVRLHLPADRETAWNNLHKRLRKDFRYGGNKGTVTTLVCCNEVDDFYEFYLRFTHQMGSPLFSKQFLLDITRSIPEKFSIVLGYNENKPVAGVFCLILRKTIFGIWGGALHEYNPVMPTHHVYWAIIEDAIHRGFDQFDIGRSPYPSSQFDFKARWCDETYPVFQYFRIYRGKMPPNLNLNQAVLEKGGVSYISRVWRKLPLSAARSLGPVIRRHIPFG